MVNFNNFRNFNTINALLFNSLYKIPQNISLIVGMPRSGMIIAEQLGEFLNKPVISIFELVGDTDYHKLSDHSLAP